jgi:hypothetical protein
MNGLLITSNKDIANMWIHEFTTILSLFLEYYYGKEAGYEYVRGIRILKMIKPIIGHYGCKQ